MQNDYDYRGNSGVLTVSERAYDRKKAMIFMALSVLIPSVVQFISSYLSINLLDPSAAETWQYWIVNNCINACVPVSKLAVTIGLGYLLTKDFGGTVRFLGIRTFGAALGGIVSEMFDVVIEIFFPIGKTSAAVVAQIQMADTIICAVLSAVFACLLYDNLEGKGKIIPVSKNEYSSVRTRMICVFIGLMVFSTFVTSIWSMSAAFMMEEESFYNKLDLVNCVISLVTGVISCALVYLVGYTLARDSADGFKFSACYNFPNIITSGIMSVLTILLGLIINYSGIGTYMSDMFGFTTSEMLTVLSAGLSSLPSLVIEVILTFWVIKYFFPIAEAQPVAEDAQCIPEVSFVEGMPETPETTEVAESAEESETEEEPYSEKAETTEE